MSKATIRHRNFVILLALFAGLCRQLNGAEAPKPRNGSQGKQAIVRSHPLLLATPAGLELARKRVREEEWAKRVYEGIAADAAQLAAEPLPVFDREWWKEASQKRWQDIYPEVHRHAGGGVGGAIARSTDAAIAYALGGERKHAETVRKILLHYATYVFEAKHPDVGMTWSGWGMAGLRAYDLIDDTLSAADRRTIDDFFDRTLAAVMENDKDWIREGWGGRFNNHYAHHKLFIGSYGLFYGKPEYVDYALESEEGFQDLIEHATRDEGLWHESALNYHFTGVGPIAQFASLLAHYGHPLDLWRQPFGKGRPVCDMLTAPIATLYPDESVPAIGDTYGHRASIEGKLYYEAFNATGDPRIGWALRGGERPAEALFLERLPEGSYPAPEMKTRIWPEHGYIALRTQEGADYWKGEGYSAFLSFDVNGIHSHKDKFNLTVFGRGAHLAVDAEGLASVAHAFSAKIQSELNRETFCHNTLMVDGKSHGSTSRKLTVVDFSDGAGCKMATLADTEGMVYRGVKLMRTVAATPEYVLDVFQAASEQAHTYDYLFHSYDDKGAFAAEGEFEKIDLGDNAPWSWIRNARQRGGDGDWAVTARQGELKMRLMMAGEAGTRLITCEFPRKDTFEPPAIPMLLARRTGKSTVFASLLQAGRGELDKARISLGPGRRGMLQVKVEYQGAIREFSIRQLE